MRVLLHGEGVTDCGISNGYGGWDEGPVQILMKKINSTLEIECISKDGIKERKKLQKSLSGLKGHGRYSALLAHIAKERQYDVAALFRDADRKQGTDLRKMHTCCKRYHEVKADIYEGFEKSRCNLEYLAIIPMKMIENWLLSDQNSFVSAFNGKAPNLPSNPELIWGDEKDPSSNHPKNRLSRELQKYHVTANRDSYCKLAMSIDVDTLIDKCPISFQDFHKQMLKIKIGEDQQ